MAGFSRRWAPDSGSSASSRKPATVVRNESPPDTVAPSSCAARMPSPREYGLQYEVSAYCGVISAHISRFAA